MTWWQQSNITVARPDKNRNNRHRKDLRRRTVSAVADRNHADNKEVLLISADSNVGHGFSTIHHN